MKELIVYIRNGCHLCDDAVALLQQLQSEYPFSMKQVDIELDDDLHKKFGLSIPVIECEGEIIQEGNIDAVELILFLQNKMVKNGCNAKSSLLF